MATQVDREERDREEQLARIHQIGVSIEKALIEIQKTRVDIDKVVAETEFMPRSMIFQAMIAAAALLGAGAAITKLFFP